jgi:nitrate reductase NapE component
LAATGVHPLDDMREEVDCQLHEIEERCRAQRIYDINHVAPAESHVTCSQMKEGNMTFREKYYSRRLVLSLFIAAVVFLVLGVAFVGDYPVLSNIFVCLFVPCMVVVLDAHYDLKTRWKAAGSPRTYVFPWSKYPS